MKLQSKTMSIRALMPFVVLGLAVLMVPVGVFAQTTEALNDSIITPPDTSVDINVVTNDIAGTPPLQNPTYVSSDLLVGTLNTTAVNGAFTYTANAGLGSTEPDSFEYQVCDSAGSCDTATVFVYVGIPITTFDIIPKKLNVKKMGVIPVVIRSTEGLDVADIVPESLMLEGVEPHRVHVGKKKITMKFKAQDIVGPIRNDVNHGDEIVLHLTGRLINESDPMLEGPVIVGEDTVIIIKKGNQN